MLSVAFGLAVGSRSSDVSRALLTTLPIAAVASLVGYFGLGLALSYSTGLFFPQALTGLPIWLPTTLVRSMDRLDAWLLLVVLPGMLATLCLWFLYELTVANLTPQEGDRSSGLRRFGLVTLLLAFAVTETVAMASDGLDRVPNLLTCIALLSLLGFFLLLVFAGEPLSAPLQLVAQWDRRKASRAHRFLGPGIINATTLLLILGPGSIAIVTATGIGWQLSEPTVDPLFNTRVLAASGGYASTFLAFLIALMAYLRTGAASGQAPRLLLSWIAFVTWVGPWLVVGLGAVLGAFEQLDHVVILAAPSPAFPVALLLAGARDDVPLEPLTWAAFIACVGWASLAATFFSLGKARIGDVGPGPRKQAAQGPGAAHPTAEDTAPPSTTTAENGPEPEESPVADALHLTPSLSPEPLPDEPLPDEPLPEEHTQTKTETQTRARTDRSDVDPE
jgi:hypothetical protein